MQPVYFQTGFWGNFSSGTFGKLSAVLSSQVPASPGERLHSWLGGISRCKAASGKNSGACADAGRCRGQTLEAADVCSKPAVTWRVPAQTFEPRPCATLGAGLACRADREVCRQQDSAWGVFQTRDAHTSAPIVKSVPATSATLA